MVTGSLFEMVHIVYVTQNIPYPWVSSRLNYVLGTEYLVLFLLLKMSKSVLAIDHKKAGFV